MLVQRTDICMGHTRNSGKRRSECRVFVLCLYLEQAVSSSLISKGRSPMRVKLLIKTVLAIMKNKNKIQ